jgi:hypothetical protein
MSARAFAAGESDTVLNNARMREARMFPVPASVSRDEIALFTAHTRIASFAMISPRMYFLDHTAANGVVYVGYIGRHLENAGSN